MGVAIFGAIANSIVGTSLPIPIHLVVTSSTAVFVGVVVVVLGTVVAALSMPNTRVPAAVVATTPAEA